MKTYKLFLALILAVVVLTAQVGSALAAPALPDEAAKQHPVALALAEFFSDITNYVTIMQKHEDGFGFGVIAQALWMTRKLDGDSEDFLAILSAKETGNYDAFADLFEDEVPQNWGQFRKAILNGEKKNNLGCIMSQTDKKHCNSGSGDIQGKGNGSEGGQGNGNGGGGQGNGNGGGQGNGKGGGQGNGGGNSKGNGKGQP